MVRLFLIPVAEEDAEVEPGAGGEVGGGVGETVQVVGFHDEVDAFVQGILESEEGGDAHQAVFSVGSGAVFEYIVGGRSFREDEVLDGTAAQRASHKKGPLVFGPAAVGEQTAPADGVESFGFALVQGGYIALAADAEMAAEADADGASETERDALLAHPLVHRAVRVVQAELSAQHITGVEHHPSAIT